MRSPPAALSGRSWSAARCSSSSEGGLTTALRGSAESGGQAPAPLEVAQLDVVVDHGHDGTEALLERNAVVQAVRRLPRRQREVVVLRFFLDLSVTLAAAALGTSEGTIKCYTARAIAQLRVLLSEDPIAATAVRSEVPSAE